MKPLFSFLWHLGIGVWLAVGFTGWAAEAAATHPLPIDLPTALRLAGAQNLEVQIAHERVAQAEAAEEQARLQFFPWLAPGIAYRRHDDRIQDVAGNIISADKQSLSPGAAVSAQLDLGVALY